MITSIDAVREKGESLAALRRAFWSKVEKRGHRGCWIWVGPGSGYGDFRWKTAHRVSYILKHGSIPEGLLIFHRCNVKRCVRWSHLYAGTYKDNSRDVAHPWASWHRHTHDHDAPPIPSINSPREALRVLFNEE